MTPTLIPRSVLAEGLAGDQLNQLAAVMLGLVVFAAIFALIERQRSRRGKGRGEAAAPPIDPPRASASPGYVTQPPAAPVTSATPLPPAPVVAPDDLPV